MNTQTFQIKNAHTDAHHEFVFLSNLMQCLPRYIYTFVNK